jgi:hypothetical protein
MADQKLAELSAKCDAALEQYHLAWKRMVDRIAELEPGLRPDPNLPKYVLPEERI